jgi:ankyrin repeat protein
VYAGVVASSSELKALNSPPMRFITAALDNDLTAVASFLRGGGVGVHRTDAVDVNVVDPRDNLFALLAATRQGHEAMVRLLLAESEINVNQAVTSRTTDGSQGNGVTSLMEASMKGYAPIATLLLEKGADVNLQTAETYGGISALWLAASAGEVEVIRLLLDAGADPNMARQADGITPLMAAAAGGHAEVVDLLLQAGAIVDTRDNDGVTALLNVAESGDLETLQLLLEAGADVNYMSNSNFSPLIVACAHGHFDAISALIDAGMSHSSLLIVQSHLSLILIYYVLFGRCGCQHAPSRWRITSDVCCR